MPIIEYRAALKVMVAVRGHAFDRTAFDALFQAMEGITATMVDQPAAALLMNPAGMAGFDALVLYDMPGLDFAAPVDAPAYVDPGEAFRAGFDALLEQGKGIVALHHAIAGWPAWPGYGERLGGTFLYRPGPLRGRERPDSGYRHEVNYVAEVVAPEHPVMAGVPAEFAMRDELYLGEVFESEVTPLLRARHAFTRGGFYSATAAIEGRMFSNDGWSHPDGSDLIGWTRRAGNSPLVYLQPGDDRTTYDNPVYRRLVENAIRWVASPEARAG
ncbi:ThuA domain-containing protein [Sphingomonas profundi]|uniref:ThuA domain-containing protein n=1 Tax=Alterirhizorhabdus profundi TaxID=2681549 RepID=UPI0012E82E59|nr:ThuA domain-containing protein [Sphingomonas profundi]